MPVITYNATNFPSVYGLTGENIFSVSWQELIWAAISVGRAELMHILRHGRYSVFEISYRTSILYANLCEDESGQIRRSSAYEGLDPSEKSAISYFWGLTLAKAFSARFFNVPWLMHLDVYREELQPVIPNGFSRPDLLGKDKDGKWVIMEAKGRTNGFDRNAFQRAKEQACQVSEVSGEVPTLNVGFQVHFGSGVMQLAAEDPKPPKGKLNLPITNEKFAEGYYRPFNEWLSSGDIRMFRHTQYRQRNLSDLDVSVGVIKSIIDTHELHKYLSEYEIVEDENTFAAMDGLLVSVGSLWSRENMMLEPQRRTA